MRDTDRTIIDLLRGGQTMSVRDFQQSLQVTATAVRQRLNRLMDQGFIQRSPARADGRGRPEHRYELTEQGRRQGGSNFGDLSRVLWKEIRSISDPSIRRGLLARIAARLAAWYRPQVTGDRLSERMEAIAKLFAERDVSFQVDTSGPLPILRVLSCPYGELAEEDRTVCSMERMMISELLGESVSLSGCRLDGDACCTFRPRQETTRATVGPSGPSANQPPTETSRQEVA